jgi:hypothetical protein
VFAVIGVVAAIIGAPLVMWRENDPPVSHPASVPVAPTPEVARERERILFLAIHDVRRMIQTIHSDDPLVSHIDRRLAKGVTDAGAVSQHA